MNFWAKILKEISRNRSLVFMCVLESQGSSPGRQGFKMYVSDDQRFEGSIGGGIMEHKLVELSKDLLAKGPFQPFIKHQIHRQDKEKDRSGMICSGDQIISFYYFDRSSIELVNNIIALENSTKYFSIILDQIGISINRGPKKRSAKKFIRKLEEEWRYEESINYKPRVNIIGGGHVGLALSQLMNQLGFYVAIYDERKGLNTMGKNHFAHENQVINYQSLADIFPDNTDDFFVIMSFGYRSDEICIKQLLGRNYRYLGVMGSQAKMNSLFDSLLKGGVSKKEIDSIHSPIGLRINSQTPMEIAVSIAAEIIAIKNEKT